MELIRIYDTCSIEYARLKVFADTVNRILMDIDECDEYFMNIENTYYDLGADWKYTAPITCKVNECGIPIRAWQSLYSRDYKVLIQTDSISKIHAMARCYARKLVEGETNIDITTDITDID